MRTTSKHRYLTLLILFSFLATLLPPGLSLAQDAPAENDAMAYRSMSFHRGASGAEEWMLREGARYGFNDICIQTERAPQTQLIIDARKDLEERGLLDVIDELGFTISLWVHEFNDPGEDWGALEGQEALANEKLWQALHERYAYYLDELFPEVDYLVLTTGETDVSPRPEEVKRKVIEVINEECRKRGKRLIVRTFGHSPGVLRWPEKDLPGIPEDVIIQHKVVPQDWNMRGLPHPLIGTSEPRDEFVEFDTGGEYFRKNLLVYCMTDSWSKRFDHLDEHGVDGISVRVDRRGRHAFNHPNVINLIYMGTRASGQGGEQEAWRVFIEKHFKPELVEELKAILYPTGEVVAEALSLGHSTFGHGRADTISTWRADENSAINPLFWNWTPVRYEVVGDPETPLLREYKQVLAGADEIIEREKAAYARQLASAQESLSRLQKIQDELDPNAYELLNWLLEENLLHLKTMEEAQLAWLYARRAMRTEDAEAKAEFQSEMETHIENMLALQPEDPERFEVTWQDRHFKAIRGAWWHWGKIQEQFLPDLRAMAAAEEPLEPVHPMPGS